MIEAYKIFWEKAFHFKGKTTRKDYWLVTLTNNLIGLIFTFLYLLTNFISFRLSIFVLSLTYLYSFSLIIPYWSITIRRMRDIEKKWQWIFINFMDLL